MSLELIGGDRIGSIVAQSALDECAQTGLVGVCFQPGAMLIQKAQQLLLRDRDPNLAVVHIRDRKGFPRSPFLHVVDPIRPRWGGENAEARCLLYESSEILIIAWLDPGATVGHPIFLK